ncbi:MAG: hypothetical protein ACK4VZ_12460, partial [Paracoccaceae bacterium]
PNRRRSASVRRCLGPQIKTRKQKKRESRKNLIKALGSLEMVTVRAPMTRQKIAKRRRHMVRRH